MENLKEYRKSSYAIPVCVDNTQKRYMLIHGYTGAMDLVSESIALLFNEKNMDKPLATNLSEDILLFLKKRGYITHKTKEEEHLLMNKIAQSLQAYYLQEKKKFYLLVNYNCNFRCPYCFENYISNKGKDWSCQIMTKEIVDNAFKNMLFIEQNREKHLNEIILYGGEPLMEQNVDIVNYIVNKGINLGYKFAAISNGYDLDLFENLLGESMIKKIQITLDGDKKYHDSRRFHYRKGASYDKIVSNILLALEKGTYVRVRSNMDSNNSESILRMVEHFHDLHLFDNQKFSFYPGLLEDNANNLLETPDKKHIEYLSSDIFENQLSKMEETKGSLSILFHNAFKNEVPVMLHASHCGANAGIYIFDPKGDIYSCLETVGIPKNIIGHYNAEKIEWTTQHKSWKERSVDKIPQCSQCSYALLCGGGCAAKIIDKDIRTPYCNNFPTILELNIRKAYKDFYKTQNAL